MALERKSRLWRLLGLVAAGACFVMAAGMCSGLTLPPDPQDTGQRDKPSCSNTSRERPTPLDLDGASWWSLVVPPAGSAGSLAGAGDLGVYDRPLTDVGSGRGGEEQPSESALPPLEELPADFSSQQHLPIAVASAGPVAPAAGGRGEAVAGKGGRAASLEDVDGGSSGKDIDPGQEARAAAPANVGRGPKGASGRKAPWRPPLWCAVPAFIGALGMLFGIHMLRREDRKELRRQMGQ